MFFIYPELIFNLYKTDMSDMFDPKKIIDFSKDYYAILGLVKENLQEDVDYYFRHLEDDNFVIQTENDYFRIFKPINQSNDRGSLVYSYSNCNPFQWSEIAGELSRYVIELDDSENSEKSIEYAYIVKKEGGISNRKQIHPQMLLDDTFDCGEILSFTIGFR